MQTILQHFPKLSDTQIKQFEQLGPFYKDWNSKINLISRKDIDNIYEHHILHALSIAKVMPFKPYTKVLDIGTGGGFPGIPLAILFPKVQFHLVDSIGKKITVVNDAIKQLGLKNVVAEHRRVQSLSEKKYDFVVSRAVTKLATLLDWSKPLIIGSEDQPYNNLANGLLVLKGGDLKAEMKKIPKKQKAKLYAIDTLFALPFYAEKYVVHVRV
jgi:16S rRNA (guanine527-N7)-methyltransferase